MNHVWGVPSNKDGRPDDSIFDHLKGTPHWIGAAYCLKCKQIFCEHCLGPDMFNLSNCSGKQ